MRRILVGSPIRQTPPILTEFLRSLAELEAGDVTLDFVFVDDNDDPVSAELLAAFAPPRGIVETLSEPVQTAAYVKDERTHHWLPDLYERVAAFKDRFIERARVGGYDGLFLVDSDLVLHPRTLHYLVATERAICSEIFWTRWELGGPELPQVWLRDQYSLFDLEPGKSISANEAQRRTEAFLAQLRVPGVYEVGGLGACTLIGRQALEAGVSFRTIRNLGLVGEDRHFCVRAAAMGIRLFVDTHVPALHLYRDGDLARVAAFRATVSAPELSAAVAQTTPFWLVNPARRGTGNRLVLSMLVRNEADRFLRPVLSHAASYVDAVMIVDDASTDDTVAVCREIVAGLPNAIIGLTESMFHRESALRAIQWQAALDMDADWILCLDADTLFEDAIRSEIRGLINQTEADAVGFRLFDFWDAEHYREDEWWRAHTIYRPFLVRALPGLPADWPEMAQHAGWFPPSVRRLPMATSEVRVKHLGWSTPRERHRRYERYRRLDPQARYGIPQQYDSILDLRPNLVRWDP